MSSDQWALVLRRTKPSEPPESRAESLPSCKAREVGMSFPKKGKFFPKENGYDGVQADGATGSFAQEIAATLRRELGESRAGEKTVEGWTGANEKTIKNWFAGKYGPSGEHLVALVRHSDGVLIAFLA